MRPYLFFSILFLNIFCLHSQNIKNYWYTGKAEISSYKLKQVRYGEIRKGIAVTVFVTESFSEKTLTKSDYPSKETTRSVLKLNLTKSFNTGIYPYHLMTSTFLSFKNPVFSKKITFSSQEWCGNIFVELLNKKSFNIQKLSYFQNENTHITIPKSSLEDDVFSIIRINPSLLKTGNLNMIPAIAYTSLMHLSIKPYKCTATKTKTKNTIIYQLYYPKLARTFRISFKNTFPYNILKWEEIYYSGGNKQKFVTSATLLKSIRSLYWQQNKNKHLHLRDSLKLLKFN